MKKELKKLLNEYVEDRKDYVSHMLYTDHNVVIDVVEPSFKGFIDWLNDKE